MRKRMFSANKMGSSSDGTVLLVLSVFFVFGTLLGSFTANGAISKESGWLYETLTSYISGYAGGYEHPSFLSALYVNFRYHLIIFLCSFTGLGIFFVPFFVVLRGFFLSFAVTGFVRILGIGGAFLSFAAFGLQLFFSLPLLILIAAFSVSSSWIRRQSYSMAGRRMAEPLPFRKCMPLLLTAAAVLFFCALLERFVSPVFISYIHNFM